MLKTLVYTFLLVSGVAVQAQDLSWSPTFQDPNRSFNSVTWTGSQFVAVGSLRGVDPDFGDRTDLQSLIMTSPDGGTWTERGTPEDYMAFNKVIWTGTKLVACLNGFSPGQGSIATSTDGINWSWVNETWSAGSNMLQDIVWTGSGYVGIGSTSDWEASPWYSIYHSTNGSHWTEVPFPETFYLRALAVHNGAVVAAGNRFRVEVEDDGAGGVSKWYYTIGSGVIRSTDNGATWSALQELPGYGFDSLASNGTILVASEPQKGLWTSLDGLNWMAKPNAPFYKEIEWLGERWVGIISTGYYASSRKNFIDFSSDLTTWVRQKQAIPGKTVIPLVNALACDGLRYVSVAGEDYGGPQGTAIFKADIPPPSAPVIKSPGTSTPSGTIITTLIPVLSWAAGPNAATYKLLITDTLSSSEAYRNDNVPGGTSFTVPEGFLQPGHSYRWQLRGASGSQESANSAPLYFTVSQSVPLPPVPVPTTPGASALPGKTLTATAVFFKWGAAKGATGYEVSIIDNRSDAPALPPISVGNTTGVEVGGGVLVPGRSYRWRVRAKHPLGWTLYSKPLYFVYQAPTGGLQPPVLASPGISRGPGPVIVGTMPQFQWQAVPGASGYGLYVKELDTERLVVDEDNLSTTTSYIPAAGKLSPGRKYRWNMRAKDASGFSLFSGHYYFQTKVDVTAPQVSGLPLGDLTGGTLAQPLIIDGSNFVTGAKVIVNSPGGPDVTLSTSSTKVEGPTRIRTTIVTGTLAGSRSLRVRNPDGKESNALSFGILAPAPGVLASPTFDRNAGSYSQPIVLTLGHPDSSPDLKIHYTTDKTTPSRASPLYTGPLQLGVSNVTVNARAYKAGATESAVVSRAYSFAVPSIKVPGSTTGLSSSQVYKLTVPSTATALNIFTDGGTGDCDLYASPGVVPSPVVYKFASEEVGTLESINVNFPAPGTWYVLVHGPSVFSGVRLSINTTGATLVTAKPELLPGPGVHLSGVDITLSCPSPDQDADIYYTTNPADPDPSPHTATRYNGVPLARSSHMQIRVRAFAPGKHPSPVVKVEYRFADISAGAMTFANVAPNIDLEKHAEKSFEIRTNIGVEDTHFFHFDVPADEAAGGTEADFPVALEFDIQGTIHDAKVYISSAVPTAKKYEYEISQLDQATWLPDAFHVNLGCASKLKKDILKPGQRYYGLLVAKGGFITDYSLTLKLRLLSSRFLKAGGGSIATNRANTWVSVHGRQDTVLPESVPQDGGRNMRGLAAEIASDVSGGGQSLLLDWSRMSSDNGLDFLHGAFYVPAVGLRATEVLSMWGISRSMTSVAGHSWGTFVAFEMGRGGKLQRLIALDPALQGGGGYGGVSEKDIIFKNVANRSTSIVSAYGLYGSEAKAGTAHESVAIYDITPSPAGIDTPEYWDQHGALHSAPVQFLTHALANPTGPVSRLFALSQLDARTLPDPMWAENRVGRWSLVANVFEAKILAEIDPNNGLEAVEGFTLQYQDAAGSNKTLTE